MDEIYDVIIVGAGIAGLSAAHTLQSSKPNVKLVILEANDRVGGRLCSATLKGPNGTRSEFDVGGHWIARTQPHAMQLINELQLQTEWQDYTGNAVSTFGSKRWKHHAASGLGASFSASVDFNLAVNKVERFLDVLPAYDFRECPYSKSWDAVTLETFKQRSMMTKEGKVLFDAMVSFTGAEPSQMSLLYFLHYCQSGGGLSQLVDSAKAGNAQEMTVKGGAFKMITCLVDKVGRKNIILRKRVVSIEQEKEQTMVTTDDGAQYEAKFVIVASPVNFKAKIVYDPPLPRSQAAFFERMPMSQATKFVVTYESKFWKEKGLSGYGRHYELDENEDWVVSMTLDNSTEDVPALVGFVKNNLGSQFSKLKFEEQKEAIIKSLVRFFGQDAASFVDFALKDWSLEPYVGGCPVGIASPGTYTLLDEENLRKPFGSIHWAGTETATLWRGHVDGAIQSGFRSAYEVLTVLKDGFIVPTLYAFNDIKLKEMPRTSFLDSIRRKGK